MSALVFVGWYYPIGMNRNAEPTHEVAARGGAMFLLMWMYLLYASTLGHMIQAGVELADLAGNYANLLIILSLIFCGFVSLPTLFTSVYLQLHRILATPQALPGFWIFMYRVSPFTYLVSAILSVGVANTTVRCSAIELLRFNPLPNDTCASYMSSYMSYAGGYLTNPDATENCAFCPLSDTNTFLNLLNSPYSDRWRNFGILWVYVVFNVAMAVLLYWALRVPKSGKREKVKRGELVDPTNEKGAVEKEKGNV